MAATFTALIKINGQEVSVLVNSEAEISIILSDLAKKLGLLISYTFIIIIVSIIEVNK